MAGFVNALFLMFVAFFIFSEAVEVGIISFFRPAFLFFGSIFIAQHVSSFFC